MNLLSHLNERHFDVSRHQCWIDEEAGVVSFPLWNLSHELVGFQQYRPNATKERRNDPREGKYFTFRGSEKRLAVWGIESLSYTPGILFVTEGIFDACRLTKLGASAIAVLSNDPSKDVVNWLNTLDKKLIAVCDADAGGKKLAKLGHESVIVATGDLGSASEEYVKGLVKQYVYHQN